MGLGSHPRFSEEEAPMNALSQSGFLGKQRLKQRCSRPCSKGRLAGYLSKQMREWASKTEKGEKSTKSVSISYSPSGALLTRSLWGPWGIAENFPPGGQETSAVCTYSRPPLGEACPPGVHFLRLPASWRKQSRKHGSARLRWETDESCSHSQASVG